MQQAYDLFLFIGQSNICLLYTSYNEIISEYEKAKDKSNEKARESAEKHHGNPDKEKDKEATPFR